MWYWLEAILSLYRGFLATLGGTLAIDVEKIHLLLSPKDMQQRGVCTRGVSLRLRLAPSSACLSEQRSVRLRGAGPAVSCQEHSILRLT
jgi:hypothetical protein